MWYIFLQNVHGFNWRQFLSGLTCICKTKLNGFVPQNLYPKINHLLQTSWEPACGSRMGNPVGNSVRNPVSISSCWLCPGVHTCVPRCFYSSSARSGTSLSQTTDCSHGKGSNLPPQRALLQWQDLLCIKTTSLGWDSVSEIAFWKLRTQCSTLLLN